MREPTEMEKRVAQAICNFSGKCQCVAFLSFDSTTCADVLVLARGALRAMREPTNDMVHASARIHANAAIPIAPHTSAWQAMIDAASPPETPKET